jgi:hypothetical protein
VLIKIDNNNNNERNIEFVLLNMPQYIYFEFKRENKIMKANKEMSIESIMESWVNFIASLDLC